jgi:hypothetical protein
MKNVLLVMIMIMSVAVTSCKKEVIEPVVTTETVEDSKTTLVGNWDSDDSDALVDFTFESNSSMKVYNNGTAYNNTYEYSVGDDGKLTQTQSVEEVKFVHMTDGTNLSAEQFIELDESEFENYNIESDGTGTIVTDMGTVVVLDNDNITIGGKTFVRV